jgi:thiol-disulfide isomerase/thioredoxin
MTWNNIINKVKEMNEVVDSYLSTKEKVIVDKVKSTFKRDSKENVVPPTKKENTPENTPKEAKQRIQIPVPFKKAADVLSAKVQKVKAIRTTIYCPYCREEIPVEANFCPHCKGQINIPTAKVINERPATGCLKKGYQVSDRQPAKQKLTNKIKHLVTKDLAVKNAVVKSYIK